MIYSIRLTISHRYDQPAANSRHLIRVIPKTIVGRQLLKTHHLEISPGPDETSDVTDFFGNRETMCALRAAHRNMSIQLACHVEMQDTPQWCDLSPTAQDLRQSWETWTDLGAESPLHFLGPTPRLSMDAAISDFAKDVCDPKNSVAENVLQLGQALHDIMTFDSSATTVDTDASEAFQLKRGVCQDMSHIMILGLQALGIPAAYVSGYLRTLPPEGGVKLEGVDAMHAWVRAWCGVNQGWIEYDPTNATLVGTDHIVVGFGRDYSDVSPVSGHLRSSGGQISAQSVDVAALDEGKQAGTVRG
ncbi:transglutaminase family protein [Shimia thalassica]|uniref:transglutaminase family protein n=1 Tax=Shimia thalassica TaxID=1715693 RepID=UPI000C08A494|nr:transglutaminase family protein [Shimia thalassica]MDO6797136.1 transglutaminase family protein [Shimia thalassica]PHO03145.1 transglutaminase [Rhodobacteraceae bacterium 4F10]